MINEILEEALKQENFITKTNITDSDKENKNENTKNKNLNNKTDEEKANSINVNKKSDENISDKKLNNSKNNDTDNVITNEQTLKNNINPKNELEKKNKINNNNHCKKNIKNNNGNINSSKANRNVIPFKNKIQINSREKEKKKSFNRESKFVFKNIYTPDESKNTISYTFPNKDSNTSNLSNNKNVTPREREPNVKEKDNYLTTQNSIQANKSKGIFSFNNGFLKKNNTIATNKYAKNFSLDNADNTFNNNIKKIQKKNNIKKKEKSSTKTSKKNLKEKNETNNKNKFSNMIDFIKVNKNDNDLVSQKEKGKGKGKEDLSIDENEKIDDKKKDIDINEKNKINEYDYDDNEIKNGMYDVQNNIIREDQKEIKTNKKKEEINNNDKKHSKEKDLIKVGREKIPFNQNIFNKIMEEVKGEKNYIQKVVHRQIMNQRDSMNHCFCPSIRKYDTKTYKEITTKKIRNPFNALLSNENKFNFSNNMNLDNLNYNLKTEMNDKDNNDNYLNISIATTTNQIKGKLRDDLNTNFNNKDDNKKSSIMIKKIPLNKLKLKSKIQLTNKNSNYNLNLYLNNNINYNSVEKANVNHRFYSLYSSSTEQDKNSYSIGYFNNSQNFNGAGIKKIPSMNYYNINNNEDLSIDANNPNGNNNKDNSKKNILYNKVKLRKRITGLTSNKSSRINKANSIVNDNSDINNNIGTKNINNITADNNSYINNNLNQNHNLPKINSSKIYYYKRNYKNYISKNYMSNIKDKNSNKDILNNTCDNNNEILGKPIQEKIIGLFKKKYSSDKHCVMENKSVYLNNNKYNNNSNKLNTTIFKSYMSNRNKVCNELNKNNNFANYNTNVESMSLLSFDSSPIDNVKMKKYYSGYFSLRKDKSDNDYIPKQNKENNPKNDIKLEQIITLLSFEDLLVVEDKLNIVLNILKNGKKSPNELFDLWNFFFSSSLKPKLEQIYKYFLNETEAMKSFINYSLTLIIICYDFSFNASKSNKNIYFSLYETLRLVYINLLIVISSIKNKIKLDNKDHYNLRLIEMSNVNKIIQKNLINFDNNSYNEDDISFNRELLHNNTNLLIKNLSLIIKNYKKSIISDLFNTVPNNSLEDIDSFFLKNILREDFLGCSVLATTYLKEKQNFVPVKIPYIHKKNTKKYSLVLDLDETLIHFKFNHEQNDEGVLKLRPGVFAFLETVREFYEIILFTEASEAYTELIMEAFNKKKYFDYKLYRHHTIIIGQDFVKDLQRIGRPLDKIIIIDNIAQNFRMQKANGINIKSFFGEDQNDQALIDLIPILINIAKDNIDTRNGLIKYRDEIITKITSNLYRRNNEK